MSCLIRRWGLLRETGDGYESCSGLYSSKGGGLLTSKLGRSKAEMFTVLLCELSEVSLSKSELGLFISQSCYLK